jgi:glycosyltransferase involved in cell wall biosynthesis
LLASTRVVTLTSLHKENLVALVFPSEKIVVIPHAINTQLFTSKVHGEQLREKLGLTDRKILLSIGRITEEKGLFFLLQTMKLVTDKVHNVHLLIVGEGPLLKSLKEYVHDLELDDYVKFLLPVRFQIFSICDIHVAPSIVTKNLVEALGMVYIEAMTSEKSFLEIVKI